MRGRGRRLLFVALCLLPVAWACGEEISIPDLITPDAAVPEEAATDATAPEAAATDAGVDAADAACPTVTPDETTGVFVAPTGGDGASCGARTAPCKTVSTGLARATTIGRAKVYVARGVYVEHVTLAAGREIIGGWDVQGTTWARACAAPEDAVVLRAPPSKNVTVEAKDLGGEARLTLLRIESKKQGDVTPGESLYGLVAVGATSEVVLSDVRIDVASAGAGTAGRKGDAGAAAPDACAPGTGGAGAAGTQGAGAPAGGFDDTGYVPGAAAAGDPGAAGDHGVAGGVGSCVQCGVCDPTCVFVPVGAPTCAKEGLPGCGGGAGAPGGAASGGGSSIGVYAWDAMVSLVGGRVKSGDGGSGGAGGAGGAGAAGSKGAAGATPDTCIVGCTPVAVGVCEEVKGRGDGGAPGGDGGAGGAGAAGGGGGGGSSFAIYQGGTGVVTTTPATSLQHGKAGAGGGPDGGAGTPGAAADRVP